MTELFVDLSFGLILAIAIFDIVMIIKHVFKDDKFYYAFIICLALKIPSLMGYLGGDYDYIFNKAEPAEPAKPAAEISEDAYKLEE